MTYRELLDKLIAEHADDKGVNVNEYLSHFC